MRSITVFSSKKARHEVGAGKYQMKARTHHQQKGFTLIEVLMAIVLITVLATIAITQFSDYLKDTKNQAVKQSLSSLRMAIQTQYAQMRLRCGASNTTAWPSLTDIQANDITYNKASNGTNADDFYCDTGEVPDNENRVFIHAGIPDNPWSDPETCIGPRDGTNVTSTSPNYVQTGTNLVRGVEQSDATTSLCGWLYDPTNGHISAATKNNGGDPDTGLDESSY